MAKLLGFRSYADYEISDQMAKNPETVKHFLDDIATRSLLKAQHEIERYRTELPQGVTVTEEGMIKPLRLKSLRISVK